MATLPAFSIANYAEKLSLETSALTTACILVLFVLIEQACHAYVPRTIAAVAKIPQLMEPHFADGRALLGRFTCSALAFTWMVVEGCWAVEEAGGWGGLLDSQLLLPGQVAEGEGSVHFQRVYARMPHGTRLAMIHFAWEVKNTFDSYVWNDGVVFIAHHLSAAGLCLLGMRDDSFLLYASYFMGVSEASSAVLSLVACFDDEKPVGQLLSRALPKARLALALAFGVLFVVFRCVLWPVASAAFWQDALGVLASPLCVSRNVAYYFLASNVFLTTLQFVWLLEILRRLYVDVRGFLATKKAQ